MIDRNHLYRLANELPALAQEHFDMQSWFLVEGYNLWPSDIGPGALHTCGTSCCALGYAAVIWPEAAKKELSWFLFCQHLFGFSHGLEYKWMFDAGWRGIDNTPQGAADRIHYYLAHGIPDWFDPDAYLDFSAQRAIVQGYKEMRR
jgi:hypothetical protein